ncbi:MAG TPA: hypothetical protein PKA59_06965, partial [Chakrabartia sp.]|nr:hypothetical protein [Chakrabartia sp.]
MPLNPQIEALLAMMAQAPAVDFAAATPQDVRASYDQSMMVGAPPAVGRVENLDLDLEGRTI